MPLSVNIHRFRPQNSVRRKLPFPAAPNVRIAQLSTNASFAGVEAFSPDRWKSLERYRPQILAGRGADLQQLVQRVQLGSMEFSSVDHAIFVLTECGDKPISDVFRVTLWQTFGVPVYELFIGRAGTVLAAECEVHEGWHVAPGAAFAMMDDQLIVDGPELSGLQTGLTGQIAWDLCPCGRAGARVLAARPFERRKVLRPLAATA